MVSFRVVRILTLPPEARSLVLEHCMREHIKRVRMYALVVMLDDVHLMFTPLRDAASRSYHLATILQAIKRSSAHSVNKLLHRQGPVWQEEYFDHVVRRYENLRAKIEYIRRIRCGRDWRELRKSTCGFRPSTKLLNKKR